MKRWVFFVARRMLQAGRRRGAGAGGLAVFGVAAGVATLVAVLAVMNGFQLGTIESILEVNSHHLRVETDRTIHEYSRDTPDGDTVDLINRISAVRGVASVTPLVEMQTLARGYWRDTQGIVVRAVPPDWLERDHGAREQLAITSGTFDVRSRGTVVLGSELARSMGVRPGDTIAVTHIPGGGTRPAEEELLVTGLFRTGYLDFDRTWGFVSLETAAENLESRDTVALGIKLVDRFNDVAVQQAIAGVTGHPVVSWREYNRGIFGALRVEKAMMVFLIAMMFLVVAGNIYQLLRRSVMERSEEIAILRALGASPREVRRIFVVEGWMIGIPGTAVGLLTGVALSVNVNAVFDILEHATEVLTTRGVRVFSPTYFYLLEVPVRVLPVELFLVAAGSLGICVAAAALAARTVGHHKPLDLLRGE